MLSLDVDSLALPVIDDYSSLVREISNERELREELQRMNSKFQQRHSFVSFCAYYTTRRGAKAKLTATLIFYLNVYLLEVA